METVRDALQMIVDDYVKNIRVELTRPEVQFGDYTTTIALQLANRLARPPRVVAQELVERLRGVSGIVRADVAGPGFINLTVLDSVLFEEASRMPAKLLTGVSYVVEYSCPNAFKELHTGHLYQTIFGDVVARLLDQAGASVHRTSFGGDVGLHVAKCLYGIVSTLGGEFPDKLADVSSDPMQRARWISRCYVLGSKAYEEEVDAKETISTYNQLIYQMHADQDRASNLAQLYWTTRQWSYDYFDAFYRLIHVDALRQYPESTTLDTGLRFVQQAIEKGILVQSEGAVIFQGDAEQKLDTRVFITSQGLPTYETKDLGVIFMEKEEYAFDKRLLITGNDQIAYVRVVFAVADMLSPGIGGSMTHITNGTVRFGDGQKMSSRLGNVSRAIDVLDVIRDKVRAMGTDSLRVDDVTLGAVKYEFLKYRIGGDISFDIEESVSVRGNSGPYLQYAHARACSILEKAGTLSRDDQLPVRELDVSERRLLRKLSEYCDVVERARAELLPHHICTYLYELAQEFNRFYENSRIIGDVREGVRLVLVTRYRDTLAMGLGLLGIVAPHHL